MINLLPRNLRFKAKISIIIFVAIFLPAMFMSIATYRQAEQAVTTTTTTSVAGNLESSISGTDASLNAAMEIHRKMIREESLLQLAQTTAQLSQQEKELYYPQIFRLMNEYISRIKAPNILSTIDSYYLYLVNQKTVITTNSTYYENLQPQQVDFVQQLAQRSFLSGWFVTVPVNYSSVTGVQTGTRLISYCQPIYDDNSRLIAVCALNIKTEMFSRLFQGGVGGVNCRIVVADNDGKMVPWESQDEQTATQAQLLYDQVSTKAALQGQYSTKLDQRDTEVVYYTSAFTGWKYIAMLDTQTMLGSLAPIRNFIVPVLCLSAILIFFIATVLSRFFYGPMQKLVDAMDCIGNGDLKTRIVDDRQDEFRGVYDGLNNMASDLEKLIHDLSTEKMLNKEAQIKLLQEQINPHFLYNTLESISSIAMLQDVPIISKMVVALSQFFRTSLSEGKNIVPLEMAVQIVQSYLTVQNIRFDDKFKAIISIPQELRACLVPKLLLQPFVENAIYHGIGQSVKNGEILIQACEIGELLMVTVADNGIGIPADELRQLQKGISGEAVKPGNFAIQNVNQQLKLRFGEEYGVSIDSVHGFGTAITIRMPVIHSEAELQQYSRLPL